MKGVVARGGDPRPDRGLALTEVQSHHDADERRRLVQPGDGGERGRTSWLETLVAGIGLLLVLGVLGYLAYAALRVPDSPPDVQARVERVEPVRAGYLAWIVVRNHGHATAQGLTVTGEVPVPGGPPERREATFDYVPGQSERRGGLFFEHDPRAGLTLAVGGFQRP